MIPQLLAHKVPISQTFVTFNSALYLRSLYSQFLQKFSKDAPI